MCNLTLDFTFIYQKYYESTLYENLSVGWKLHRCASIHENHQMGLHTTLSRHKRQYKLLLQFE